MPTPTTSPADRWRPRDRRGPSCGYTFRGKRCTRRGAHYCEPRADRAAGFFPAFLVHTKGRWARQPFRLEPWQEHEIIRPLFGEVLWSDEFQTYVRRYTVAWVCVGRKNGKTEVAAGIVLLLLIGDDEEAAEVYGAAADTKQADKVGQVVWRMRELNPTLRNRLTANKQAKRIADPKTASFYDIITSDALGELGANPHGAVVDELLSQPDGSLWAALRTSAGTRTQPLFLGVTTETDDPSSWAAATIDEAERIEEDPSRAPHVFTFIRKLPTTAEGLDRLRRLYPGHPDLPVSTDPFDERNWAWPNPALGSFLSKESIRREALEAQNEPAKENAFRQFKTNQRVQQTTRWMPLHLWDACGGLVVEEQLIGRECYGGLDLSATTDLTALAWFFPGTPHILLWRFFVPEAEAKAIEKFGLPIRQWAREGYVTLTSGNVVDYEAVKAQILEDATRFDVVNIGIDRWNSTWITNWLEEEGIDHALVGQGFMGMSPPMGELMRLVRSRSLNHGGNPVARWNADSIEVKQDPAGNVKPVKPDRRASGRRIDGMVAAFMAVDGWSRAPEEAVPAVW